MVALTLGTLTILPQWNVAGLIFGLLCVMMVAFGWKSNVLAHKQDHTQFFSPTTEQDAADVEDESEDNTAGLHMLHVKDECDKTNTRGIAMNSVAPVPFENELFKGHVYFLIKTNPTNTTWQHLFQGRKRMFWIQVQGTLKQKPKGSIYLGGELPSSVSIGLLARGMAQLIMGIMQRLVGIIHFSFGDEVELPHCVFPLYQAVDELVITPEGSEPPILGQFSFGESNEDVQRRRRTPVGEEEYIVGATYTFHFHTMYVDLTRWKIINLPGMKDINLTTFFAALPLRLTCYDVVASPKHDCENKQYLFCFTVQFFGEGVEASVPESVENDVKEKLSVPYWVEKLDGSRRQIYYLVPGLSSKIPLSIIPAKLIAKELRVNLHNTSRLARYDSIEEQRSLIENELHSGHLSRTRRDFQWTSMSATALGIRISKTQTQRVILQQEILRAITDTQLRQEYLVLTRDALFFYRTQSKSPCMVVYLGNILKIRSTKLPYLFQDNNDEIMSAICIDTPAEVITICLPTKFAQDEWIRMLNSEKIGTVIPDSPALHVFLPLSPQRIILNSRILFPQSEDCHMATNNALNGVRALANNIPNFTRIVSFLNAVSVLRQIDIDSLTTHEQKLAFFLNLYNLLRWHSDSCLPPSSRMRAAYRVGRQRLILSLTEIENFILRARFKRPEQAMTSSRILADRLAPYAIGHPDFRILFALHVPCASMPIFKPDQIHHQLNQLCSFYLRRTVGVDVHRLTIHLPMIFLKYRYDFGPSGDVVDCPRKIMGFLDESVREKLQTVLDAESPNVQIHHYEVQGVLFDGYSID